MHLALAFFLTAVLITPLSAQEQHGAATLTELQQRLTAHVTDPKFDAAMWGVKIVSSTSGKVLFDHNASKLLSPASNSKLYTMALALDRLGPDYRIKTSLLAAVKPTRSGLLKGDLVLYGRGDPTINARLHEGDSYRALDPLVAALTNAGVKKITGNLVADGTFFRGAPFGSGWAWDDMEYYYGAEISALTINDNVVQVLVKPGARSGQPCQLTLKPTTSFVILSNRTFTASSKSKRSISFHRPIEQNIIYVTGEMAQDDAGYTEDVTVHQPGKLFGVLFRNALAQRGIKISGKVIDRSLETGTNATPITEMIELGAVESLPLSEMVREVMKPSQNLYTDLLLEHLGETKRNSGDSSSSENLGIAELNRFLVEIGLKKDEFFFEEGSGLSRNNLTAPQATIKLLQHMAKHKSAQVFLDALPSAGVDGTLRNRMKGTAAAGNVRAKTGTLRWANSLSGYVTSAAGERLIFSIMLNRYQNLQPDRSARDEIDAVAIMLAEFTGHAD